MSTSRTDYEKFERSSVANRRLLRQEDLILEVTEALSEALAQTQRTKSELAIALGKSKGFVSQLLAGGRNLTLRTVADVADALGCRARFTVEPEAKQSAGQEAFTFNDVIKMSPPQLHVANITSNEDPILADVGKKLAA